MRNSTFEKSPNVGTSIGPPDTMNVSPGRIKRRYDHAAKLKDDCPTLMPKLPVADDAHPLPMFTTVAVICGQDHPARSRHDEEPRGTHAAVRQR